MTAPRKESKPADSRVFSPAPFFSGYGRHGAAKGAEAASQVAPDAEKRADVGAGARIVMLLAERGRPMTAAEIASILQTSEESLAEAIARLAAAGVVHMESVRGACLLDLVPSA